MIEVSRPIILADDNANDVELILAAFDEARLPNQVLVTRDGAEALNCVYRRGEHAQRTPVPPALVLLDLKMPKVDGKEVLRQIRADPELQTVPVVILTSSKEESDLVRTYELGANGYVVKPMGFDEFSAAVGRLGSFWTLLNELPASGSAGDSRS
jgi:CheY-like chemotaxis protein